MYRKFITTIAAASIALTAIGAVPAAAGERETVNAIAAILGLAVVGKIIHDRNERKDERRREYHAPVHKPYKPQNQHVHREHTPKYQPPVYHQPKPRPLPQRVNRKLLPKQCFRSYETYRGKVRMFPKKCLRRNYQFVQSLPRSCEYIFNTSRGDRRGYEARCLKDNGYRLARG